MILKLCNAEDIPAEGATRAFRRPGLELCLVRLAGERLAVFGNRCPHQGAPLSAGVLEGQTIVCPYHAWRFDVVTGRPEMEGDPPLLTYEARRYGGEVFVRVPEHKGAEVRKPLETCSRNAPTEEA